LYYRSCFEVTSVRILNEPASWLKILDDVAARKYKFISTVKVPRCFGVSPCYTIVTAIRGSPHDLEVARLIDSFVIPGRNVCLDFGIESAIPVYISHFPA
jgi:hypothetical protein